MNFMTAIGLLIAFISGFFILANYQTRRSHAQFTPSAVAGALEELLSPNSSSLDEWDLFLAWPIDDPFLESIRQRCLIVIRECPAKHSNEDMSQKGLENICALLAELQANTSPSLTHTATP